MDIEDVMRLVTFMRASGVQAFKFGDLEVDLGPGPAPLPRGPVFADQERMRALDHPEFPPEMDEDSGFTDDDLYGSAT